MAFRRLDPVRMCSHKGLKDERLNQGLTFCVVISHLRKGAAHPLVMKKSLAYRSGLYHIISHAAHS